jgi:pimeloyl-ACP methyl ester carboxylesterase
VTVTIPLLVAFVALAAVPAVAQPDGISFETLKHGTTAYRFAKPGRCPPDGCRLVVLVAGYAVPMVVWDETVPALVAKGFAVLRFDFYGRGRSDRPHVDYDPELFAAQLQELVTRLRPKHDLPPRFHVVASSMGGIAAAVFGSRHPDVLERVVLVSPAGLSETFPSIVTLLKVPGVGRWYFRRRFESIMFEHLQDNFLADYRRYPDVLAEFRRQLVLLGAADAMYSTLRRTLLRESKDDFRNLGGLHRPTRVVWGTADRLVPFKDSRAALESAIPHYELCAVPKAAHLPQVEQPQYFNTLVVHFLASQPDPEVAKCDPGPFKR